MPCPVCAGECRCGRSDETLRPVAGERVSVLVDPEDYEPSEERFSITLATPIQEEPDAGLWLEAAARGEEAERLLTRELKTATNGKTQSATAVLAVREVGGTEPPEWKREVASRVTRYRSRRRSRKEHNRSLGFNFEAASKATPRAAPIEAISAAPALDAQQSVPVTPPALPPGRPEDLLDVHVDLYGLQRQWPAPAGRAALPNWRRVVARRQAQWMAASLSDSESADEVLPPAASLLEKVAAFNGDTLSRLIETVRVMEMKNYVGVRALDAKVIEFPGGQDPEVQAELAEPVVTAPRIFEAADVEQAEQEQELHSSTAPATPLPTFLLDSPPIAETMKHEFELPLPVAPIAVRALGLAVDFAVVTAASVLFASTLVQMHSLPAGRPAVSLLIFVFAMLWCAYQGLFLLRQGSTLGMRAAGLVLVDFETRPLCKARLRMRTWSVMLSSAALGLGFAWALLDEDRLCWHDRISRSCTVVGEQ